jgi:hypothetical protein
MFRPTGRAGLPSSHFVAKDQPRLKADLLTAFVEQNPSAPDRR